MDPLLLQRMTELKAQLSDAEWKLLKELREGKPGKSFSKMTLSDNKREDGLHLNLQYIEPRFLHWNRMTLHLPSNVAPPTPSDWLLQGLKMIGSTWAFNTEMARRTIIDAIITESLYYSESNLVAFCETSNGWRGTGFEYTGNVDYMIGSSESHDTADNIDSFVLVVEAKLEWPISALPQVLAEAGCLLKKRMAAGKNTPVFAVLTNAEAFQFFAIDIDDIVYCSGRPIPLTSGPENEWATSTSLVEILRWFKWFITFMASVSPSASRVDISLASVRECFGVR